MTETFALHKFSNIIYMIKTFSMFTIVFRCCKLEEDTILAGFLFIFLSVIREDRNIKDNFYFREKNKKIKKR